MTVTENNSIPLAPTWLIMAPSWNRKKELKLKTQHTSESDSAHVCVSVLYTHTYLLPRYFGIGQVLAERVKLTHGKCLQGEEERTRMKNKIWTQRWLTKSVYVCKQGVKSSRAGKNRKCPASWKPAEKFCAEWECENTHTCSIITNTL